MSSPVKLKTQIEKPFANELLRNTLLGVGFSVTKYTQANSKAPVVVIKGTPTNVMALMPKLREKDWNKQAPDAKRMTREILSTDENWKGGSYETLLTNLSGEIEMTRYYKERDKLKKTGFERKLREKIAMIAPRRTRCNSEHDGEWSLDRKWDTTPFQATKKALGAGRTLDITVNLCASAGVDSKDFDRFGTQVWAISDLIEGAGIQTRITAQYDVGRLGETKEGGQVDGLIQIQLKDPTQFVTPTRLAACFTTNFYRRPVFALMVGVSQLENGEVDYGLGSPRHAAYPIKFLPENGSLTMNVGTMGFDQNDMTAEILAAVDATVGAA